MTDHHGLNDETVRDAAADMLDALYAILNIEGPAKAGVDRAQAWNGLDIPWHFKKVRNAIRRAEGLHPE